MPFAPHALVQLQGGYNTTDAPKEVWTMGIRVRRTGTTGFLSAPDAYLADIQAGISSWFSTTAHQISNRAVLKLLKVNNINADGHYVDTVTHQHDYGAGIAGGITPTCSADNSLVYTWTTDSSRGLAHIGRVYPPNNTITISGAVSVSTADVTVAVSAAKALLSVLNINSDGDSTLVRPVICSKKDASYKVITGVKVGSVYDTQRRRRNRAPEVYGVSVWP